MSKVDQSLFMRAIRKAPVERTPLWIMRQAGRYLPEYRKVREKAGDFLTLCKTPDLACEVTLQPLRRYALDAAILFSDILTIPAAMGLDLYFAEGEGPRFQNPISDIKQINTLPTPDMQNELGYVMDAASLIRREMPQDIPLIGFSGSPWTLACYMVEGQGSKDFKKTLKLMYSSPESMHLLLDKLKNTIKDYLIAQVEAGVNALMIFDTWGGILSKENYGLFSLSYMSNIIHQVKEVHPHVPITLFTKGGGQWLKDISTSGCDVVGLDWTTHIGDARNLVGNQVALQGNLDPSVLLTNRDSIRRETLKVLENYGKGSGHIFNLGHGITPDVPPEHVSALIEAIHEFSPSFH